MISNRHGTDDTVSIIPNVSSSAAAPNPVNYFPGSPANVARIEDALSQIGPNAPSLCHDTAPIAPTVARFTSSDAPMLTEALILAERIHLALVKLSQGSPVFTGCDSSRKPLQGNGHAYILCESNQAPASGGGGEITHVTVYAPMGFGPQEQKALESLQEVWGPWQDRVRLLLQGMGRPEDFCGPEFGCSSLLVRSRTWISLTPFLPTRHAKVTRAGAAKRDARGLQIGSPEHELRRLLLLAGFPEPVAVEPVPFAEIGGHKISWSSFCRERSCGQGRRAGNAGYGFRIEFPEPVQGPVAAGYAAHFGMGGFMSEKK